MTAQSSEDLIYNNESYRMFSEPLEQYLSKLTTRPYFYSPNTACWRGYRGWWEIRNDRLFLVNLILWTGPKSTSGIEFLFPGKQVVFADWFSGEIRLPKGELLEYLHSGYESIYEEDLILKLKGGVVGKSQTVNNHRRCKKYLREVERNNKKFPDVPF